MATRKKTTPTTTRAKTSAAAAITSAAVPTPVARSESKGSGTLAANKAAIAAPKAPITYEQIAERAYQIYLKRGFGPGDAHSDWIEAERQLKAGR